MRNKHSAICNLPENKESEYDGIGLKSWYRNQGGGTVIVRN